MVPVCSGTAVNTVRVINVCSLCFCDSLLCTEMKTSVWTMNFG